MLLLCSSRGPCIRVTSFLLTTGSFAVVLSLILPVSLCGSLRLRDSLLAPSTPLLCIKPLRDCCFAVDAVVTRVGSLQQYVLPLSHATSPSRVRLKCLSFCSRAVSNLITKFFIAASDSGTVACFSVSMVSNTTVWSAPRRDPLVRSTPPAGHRSSCLNVCLSGHRHLLRNVIRTAVSCDCASYS